MVQNLLENMEIRQNLLEIILLLRGPERVTQCQGKPRFFNRVKTGFEWNKYNQTHYDHDNPPPKIVQGAEGYGIDGYVCGGIVLTLCLEGCRSRNIFDYSHPDVDTIEIPQTIHLFLMMLKCV
jgi:hypothetical protein